MGSNITARNKDQIQHVIEHGLIPPLIKLLAQADRDVKREAAFATSNATSGSTPQQIMYLVSQQCIRPLCNLLTVQDLRIINVALEGIENILKLGEGLRALGLETNEHARFVLEADGVDKLLTLQVFPLFCITIICIRHHTVPLNVVSHFAVQLDGRVDISLT